MPSNPNSDTIVKRIKQYCAALKPSTLMIEDETYKHLKHQGHQLGTYHYHLIIKSDALDGLGNRVAQHRAIYKLIAPVQQWIHSIRFTIQ